MSMHKREKDNKKRWPVICIIATVIAIGLLVYFLVIKNPRRVIVSAMKNTLSEQGQENYFHFDQLLGTHDYDFNDIDVELDMHTDSTTNDGRLKDFSEVFRGSFEKDENRRDYSLESSTTVNGANLEANFYSIDDILYEDMPQLYSCILEMDALHGSIFGYNMEGNDISDIRELYNNKVKDKQDKLLKSFKYNSDGKKTIKDENGIERRCSKYTITVPNAKVIDYIQGLSDFAIEYADTYMTEENYENLGVSINEFKEIIGKLPATYMFVCTKDIEFDVYIYQGKLARIEVDYDLVSLDANFVLKVDFKGEDFRLHDIDGYVRLKVGDQVNGAHFSYLHEKKGDKIITDIALTTSIDSDLTATYYCNFDTDIETMKYTNHILLSNDVRNVYIDSNGQFTNVVKGKSCTIEIPSIVFKNDEGAEVTMNGVISFGNLDKEIAEPDYAKVKSFEELKNSDDFYSYYDGTALADFWDEASKIIFAENDDDENDDESASGFNLDIDLENDEDLITDVIEIPEDEEENAEALISEAESDDVEVIYDREDDALDYSNVIIKQEGYEITISDPDGYERDYSDENGITLFNDDGYAYYYVLFDDTVENIYDTIKKSYKEMDDTTLEKSEQIRVDIQGTSIICIKNKITTTENEIMDVYYFYPLDGGDYLILNVELDDFEGYDYEELGNVLLNSNVVSVE